MSIIKNTCDNLLALKSPGILSQGLRKYFQNELIGSVFRQKKAFPLVQLWFLRDIVEAVYPRWYWAFSNNLDKWECRSKGVICICEEKPASGFYEEQILTCAEGNEQRVWFVQLSHSPN